MPKLTPRYPDCYLHNCSKTGAIILQLATPASYALCGDQPFNSGGCISLTEDAYYSLEKRIDAAGLWLKPS